MNFFIYILHKDTSNGRVIFPKEIIFQKIVTLAQIWPHFYVSTDIYIFLQKVFPLEQKVLQVQKFKNALYGSKQLTYYYFHMSLFFSPSFSLANYLFH